MKSLFFFLLFAAPFAAAPLVAVACLTAAPLAASARQLPSGQDGAPWPGGQEILLWPNGAPGSEGKTAPEKVRIAETGDHVISSIHRPSITAFLPEHGTGAAVIIAPGGGHAELWIDHEGYNPAKYFQGKGIAAFVLKYRLAREQGSTYTVDKDEVADIQRAIRLVRSRAKEWGIDTGRLGVMGFSAGGELAALAAMRFDSVQTPATDDIDRLSARPDFQALIYPGNSHRLHVAPNAPPVFIVAGFKDRPDISEGAAEVYLQYKRAGVPAELHIYEAVGHGFGMRPTNTGAVTGWPDRFIEWLREIGQLPGPLSVNLGNNQSLALAWIPPGSFTMGSPSTEPGHRSDESPQTQVTLTRGYWLGQTEVTIAQWKAVMNETLRDHVVKMLKDETIYDFGNGHKATLRAFMRFDPGNPDNLLLTQDDNAPMYFVSWDDAMDFCKMLTADARTAGTLPEGYAYTLPTEAQWEYACRAGTTTPTFAGNADAGVMDNIAWYGHSHGGPSPVGEKEANAWGLGDMPGNLWEWCRDWYGPYPGGITADPTGAATGAARVNRGGSWGSGLSDERSATRAANPQPEKSAYRGFRVALCAITPAS